MPAAISGSQGAQPPPERDNSSVALPVTSAMYRESHLICVVLREPVEPKMHSDLATRHLSVEVGDGHLSYPESHWSHNFIPFCRQRSIHSHRRNILRLLLHDHQITLRVDATDLSVRLGDVHCRLETLSDHSGAGFVGQWFRSDSVFPEHFECFHALLASFCPTLAIFALALSFLCAARVAHALFAYICPTLCAFPRNLSLGVNLSPQPQAQARSFMCASPLLPLLAPAAVFFLVPFFMWSVYPTGLVILCQEKSRLR